MSGEVKHAWNGSVLTIISDSGASSSDLIGPKGDTGPRGPQGPGGVIYDEQGEVVIDLEPYATVEEVQYQIEQHKPNLDNYATKAYTLETVINNQPDLSQFATMNYVDNKVDNVQIDLSPYATKDYVDSKAPNLDPYATKVELTAAISGLDIDQYATENYVSTQIAKAQLQGAEVDMSGFATLDDLKQVSVNIDNKTLVLDSSGKVRTAIGGYEQVEGGAFFTSEVSTWVKETSHTGGSNMLDYVAGICDYEFEEGKKYVFSWARADGTGVDTFSQAYFNQNIVDKTAMIWQMKGSDNIYRSVYIKPEEPYTVYVSVSDSAKDYYTSFTIYDGEPVTTIQQIDAKFIPIDGVTLVRTADGKIASLGSTGSGGVVLENYYTKTEIDELLANLSIEGGVEYPSGEEVKY